MTRVTPMNPIDRGISNTPEIVNFITTEPCYPVLPSTGIMVHKGNNPKIAELFRLVKYDTLPDFTQMYCRYA